MCFFLHRNLENFLIDKSVLSIALCVYVFVRQSLSNFSARKLVRVVACFRVGFRASFWRPEGDFRVNFR